MAELVGRLKKSTASAARRAVASSLRRRRVVVASSRRGAECQSRAEEQKASRRGEEQKASSKRRRVEEQMPVLVLPLFLRDLIKRRGPSSLTRWKGGPLGCTPTTCVSEERGPTPAADARYV